MGSEHSGTGLSGSAGAVPAGCGVLKPFKVVARYGTAEFVERRSRFIGQVWPVPNEDEALKQLQAVRTEYRDASHNVYGYRLKENNIMRYSDDGEPAQTAGLPLLEAFLRTDVYNFLCVGTRYFGGVLLGAGGLVRAYAQTGRLALERGGVAVMRLRSDGVVTMPYSMLERVRRLLASIGAVETDIRFGADVDIYFSLPSEQWQQLLDEVTEMSGGSIEPVLLNTGYGAL